MNGQSIGEHNRLVRPRIRHKPTKPKPVATPLYTFYSIKSLDDLQNKHPDKLNNTSNIFHFKDTKSSLYYSKKDHQWVELKLANPDDPVQKFPLSTGFQHRTVLTLLLEVEEQLVVLSRYFMKLR